MIKILYIEDDSSHIELTSRSLENSGIQFDLETASTITSAFNLLKNNEYDVILSDYRLPDGSGLDVIRMANEQILSTAIVLITNQEDINTAVAALKAGAVDYIVKQSDYLHKLPIVLSNAYKHTQIEKQKKALSEIENKYHNIFENAVEGIFQSSLAGRFISVNPAMAHIYGYSSPDDMVNSVVSIGTQIHTSNENRAKFIESLNAQGFVENYEAYNLRKDGSIIWTSTNARAVKDELGNTLYLEGFVKDITTQKQAEKLLERQLKALTVLHAAAIASSQGNTEAGIIEQVTRITASIYSDVCGVLLLNDRADILTPHPSYIGANIINWEHGYPISKGITGRAVRTGDSIRINDISTDPNYIEISSETKSEICIPFHVQDRIIGVLNVESKQINAFDEEDERLLNTIAGGLGTAIEKLRLFKAEQAQRQRESAILDLIRTAASSLDLNQVLQSILEQLVKVIPSDSGTIQLLEGDYLYSLAAIGKEAVESVKRGPLLLSEFPLNNYVVTEKQTIVVKNVPLDDRYRFLNKDTNIRSFLGIPLIANGNTIGMITLDSYQISHFTNQDAELGLALANHASIAIENARLFDSEQKRRKQAEILREATGVLTSFFEQDKLFENIFATLAKLVNYDSVSIEIINGGYAEIVAGQNIPKELIGRKYLFDPHKWHGAENLRQPVIISDTQTDKRFEKFEQTNYIRGWMGISLFSKDKIIGFLNFDSRTPNFFNEEHAAIAQTFANQVAIAIENSRLFELEHQRRNEAEVLNQATSALANTLDINNLFENILDWLKKIVPYDSASIMILNQGKILRLVAQRDLPSLFSVGQSFPITRNWEEIVVKQKPNIIEDAQLDPYFEKWEGSAYIRGWMGIPMFIQDKLIGFINLDSKTAGTYSEEHVILVQTFANQAATAIENARLFEQEQIRRKEAEIVRQAATILSNLLDLPSLHEAILEWLHKILPYDSASILEIEREHIRITATRGLLFPEKIVGKIFSFENALSKIIFETGEPLIIEDCENDPRFENWGDTEIHGWMGVPMITRGRVIGYITIDSHTPNAFTKNDAVAAQTFAHQAANSLENSRLYTETLQRLEELEMVSRVSYALRAAHDTKEMIPILLNEIKTNMDTDSAAIWLYNAGMNELLPIAASGGLKNLPNSTFKPNEGIIGRVFSTGTMHISPELIDGSIKISENENFLDNDWGGVTIPIRTVSETIGVLAVALPAPHKIGENQIRLITTLTEIAGNAIYRSNLFEQSEEQIRRLTTLREMDTAITSSLDLHVTLGILTEHLLTKMDVSAATVLVFNTDSQTLDSYASSGFKNNENIYTQKNIGDGLAGQILLTRRAIYISDLSQDPNLLQSKPLLSEQFVSYYAIPLFSKGATKGILETYFRHSFSPNADWLDFLHTLAEQAIIAIDNAQLFENLQQSNYELSLAYDTTLEGWGKALELRDKETQGHTQRVTNLTLELARQMNIPETELLQIRRGSLLHDIGKMGVPDNILHKNGPLTEDELFEMRKHPKYAYDLLYPIAYLRPALDIAYCHHEWWDGTGYPRGLKGEEIPLSARLFAIIDVWDALLSDRPYRPAWSHQKALKYIKDLSDKQFDPYVVDIFCKMIESDREYTKPGPSNKIRKSAAKKPVSKNKKR